MSDQTTGAVEILLNSLSDKIVTIESKRPMGWNGPVPVTVVFDVSLFRLLFQRHGLEDMFGPVCSWIEKTLAEHFVGSARRGDFGRKNMEAISIAASLIFQAKMYDHVTVTHMHLPMMGTQSITVATRIGKSSRAVVKQSFVKNATRINFQ